MLNEGDYKGKKNLKMWIDAGSKEDVFQKSGDMFIAQVVGKSMEPTIPDGGYCIFRFKKGGSRNGLIVLVESRHVSDPELYQRYTIKRYRSKKEVLPDGTWIHKKIILSPDNIDFEDIIIVFSEIGREVERETQCNCKKIENSLPLKDFENIPYNLNYKPPILLTG
ncbi:MAG: hypothetical protein K0R54_4759 [Clostridiaceae bacterium]|jgi:hypothetical protein|nr:hypothetical protein [Clostridiaceae bacterium]